MTEKHPEQSYRSTGRVFAWNPIARFGFVRTSQNVRVLIAESEFASKSLSPRLGDQLAFDLVDGPEGPYAIQISASLPEVATVTSNKIGESPNEVQLPLPTFEMPEDNGELGSDDFLPDSSAVPLDGPDWKTPYSEAIVARSENRIADARLFFEKSIATGVAPQQVYTAFAKMEMEKGSKDKANQLIEGGLKKFPAASAFYVLKGKMERQAGRIRDAEKIFRAGLQHAHNDTTLRQSLARTLADIGSAASFKEAHQLFEQLDKEGKVNRGDRAYQRYRALKDSPRASRAYSFFDRLPGFHVGIPGRKGGLAQHVTDLIVETHHPELEASFGLSGAYLLRCFDESPGKADIQALLEFLRGPLSDTTVGLETGKDVSVNTNMAFVVVPGTGAVRDQFMSVLSENNEALIPLDDGNLTGAGRQAKELLGQLLAQYLGSRDLYLSTLPVSGRRFFGRERLLVQITDQIRRGEFIGLFGLRKMGKTSLVYQLRDQKLREEAVAYIDLQASPALILKTFGPIYWEIERELLARTAVRWPQASKFLRLSKYERYSDVPFEEPRVALIFSEDLRALLSDIAAGKGRGFKRVVIVLDELERILPINAQEPIAGYLEFFALLRGLAQTDVFQGVISSVVVAANALISEKSVLGEPRKSCIRSLSVDFHPAIFGEGHVSHDPVAR